MAVAILVVAGSCASDDDGETLNLDDEMQVVVVGDCVEFDLPDYHSSACVAGVGGDLIGPPDAQWFTGFAPAETDVITSGDQTEDRFVEFDDLKAFAIPYEPGDEIAALNSDGLALHIYSTSDELSLVRSTEPDAKDESALTLRHE